MGFWNLLGLTLLIPLIHTAVAVLVWLLIEGIGRIEARRSANWKR